MSVYLCFGRTGRFTREINRSETKHLSLRPSPSAVPKGATVSSVRPPSRPRPRVAQRRPFPSRLGTTTVTPCPCDTPTPLRTRLSWLCQGKWTSRTRSSLFRSVLCSLSTTHPRTVLSVQGITPVCRRKSPIGPQRVVAGADAALS